MSIEQELKNRGYSDFHPDPIYKREAVYCWKSIKGTVKQSISVQRWNAIERMPVSYTVEICFESKKGIWVKVQYYGLSEKELLPNLSRIERNLKRSIPALDGNSKHYGYSGE